MEEFNANKSIKYLRAQTKSYAPSIAHSNPSNNSSHAYTNTNNNGNNLPNQPFQSMQVNVGSGNGSGGSNNADNRRILQILQQQLGNENLPQSMQHTPQQSHAINQPNSSSTFHNQNQINMDSQKYHTIIQQDQDQEFQKIFDGDKFPPDLEFAKKHGQAQRMCKFIEPSEMVSKNNEICPCCGMIINNELLSYCDHPDNIKHAGTTYPLYFTFIKQCFIYMLVNSIIQSIPALIMYTQGNFCSTRENSTFICYISILNILEKDNKDKISQLSIINFVCIFVQLVLVEIFRIYQSKKIAIFQEQRKSVYYYSIIVKHFPSSQSLESFLNYLEERIPDSKNQIEKVFLLYNLNVYDQLIQDKNQLTDKINYLLFQNEQIKKNDKLTQEQKDEKIKQNEFHLIDYQRQKAFKEDNMQELYEILIDQGQQNVGKLKDQAIYKNYTKNHMKYNLKFTGKIIITFSTHQMQKNVINYFKKTFWENVGAELCFIPSLKKKILHKQYFFTRRLLIKEAPEPSDILWTGIASIKNKKCLRIKSNLTVYFTMLIFLVILIYLKFLIKQASKDYSSFWQLAIGLVAATLVAIANVLTGIIIRKNATKEDRTTQTSYFVQVGRKLTKMFLINMLLTIFFSSAVYNIFAEDGRIPNFINSLIGEYFFLFITNSYISSFMSIFDIVWIVRLIKRYVMTKQVKENRCYKSQREANDVFEGHPIDMALRYANVLKVVLYTLAISSLLPVGGFMCLIGLIIIYWADKHLLFRRMVCKNFISTLMQKEMMKLLHFSTVLFAFGNFLTLWAPVYNNEEDSFKFDGQRGYGYFFLSAIGFFVALFFHYIPTSKFSILNIYKKCDKKYKKLEIVETYKQLKEQIFDDYDLYHPASKDKTMHGKLDKLDKLPSQNLKQKSSKAEQKYVIEETKGNNNDVKNNIQQKDKQNKHDDINISQEPEQIEFTIEKDILKQTSTNNQDQQDEILIEKYDDIAEESQINLQLQNNIIKTKDFVTSQQNLILKRQKENSEQSSNN